jgi:transposase-like protein
MTFIAVRCTHCQSDQIVKRGKTAKGTQRYLCQNTLCVRGSFLLDYRNRGCLPEVKQTIIDMSLNASGVRDTARSLHICPNTVLRELKKKATALESVNTALLRTLNPDEVAWDVERAGEAEAEMDEMWSDTVGEPPSADIGVSHMPSWKAKKLGKLPREKVLLEL